MTKNLFAIVIGGTGMLERVCHFLAEEGYDVYVVHRNKNKFQAMQGRCLFPHKLYSISVDYHDEAALQKKIQEAIQLKGGYPDLIVSWIHNSAPPCITNDFKGSNREKETLEINSRTRKLFFLCKGKHDCTR